MHKTAPLQLSSSAISPARQFWFYWFSGEFKYNSLSRKCEQFSGWSSHSLERLCTQETVHVQTAVNVFDLKDNVVKWEYSLFSKIYTKMYLRNDGTMESQTLVRYKASKIKTNPHLTLSEAHGWKIIVKNSAVINVANGSDSLVIINTIRAQFPIWRRRHCADLRLFL